MLGSFRIRMLLVIVIVTMVGLSMQSEHKSRQLVEPVIKYILTDYGLEKKVAGLIENVWEAEPTEVVPSSGDSALQLPCEFVGIARSYGWYWNKSSDRQEFSPGVCLQVHENSLVRPVMAGNVVEVSKEADEYTVLIKHEGDLSSFYGGLKEVAVKAGEKVDKDKTLGRTGIYLNFEIRNEDGPLNPNNLFE